LNARLSYASIVQSKRLASARSRVAPTPVAFVVKDLFRGVEYSFSTACFT
jgi:hypothetical protein